MWAPYSIIRHITFQFLQCLLQFWARLLHVSAMSLTFTCSNSMLCIRPPIGLIICDEGESPEERTTQWHLWFDSWVIVDDLQVTGSSLQIIKHLWCLMLYERHGVSFSQEHRFKMTWVNSMLWLVSLFLREYCFSSLCIRFIGRFLQSWSIG